MSCAIREISDGYKKIEVIISKDYLIGKYPVKQDQWEAVMGENPSCFKLGPDHHVEQVSWEDCQRFIDKLNGIEGGKYRLPTEAEWEFACRAYSTTTVYCYHKYGFGEYAWYNDNSRNITHEVGLKKPNAWGLHDMHGNVWEWCQDSDGALFTEESTDPDGESTGKSRILRGGSWDSFANSPQLTSRLSFPSDARLKINGFRLARTL